MWNRMSVSSSSPVSFEAAGQSQQIWLKWKIFSDNYALSSFLKVGGQGEGWVWTFTLLPVIFLVFHSFFLLRFPEDFNMVLGRINIRIQLFDLKMKARLYLYSPVICVRSEWSVCKLFISKARRNPHDYLVFIMYVLKAPWRVSSSRQKFILKPEDHF